MKRPKKVKICGSEYVVKYLANPAEVNPASPHPHFGAVSDLKKEIRIYSALDDYDTFGTLFHEIFHVVDGIVGCEMEEKDVNAFASLLWEALDRNGLLKISR